jgi:hypothetical protein
MGESAHRKTGDEIMSTKSKIVLSFGLFLAAVSAAAAAPHQANIHTSQLGIARANTAAAQGPARTSADEQRWFNHQDLGLSYGYPAAFVR